MIFIKNEFVKNLNVWNVDNLFQSIFSFIFHSATLENPKLIICYTKKSLFSYICVVKLQYDLHNTFNIYSVFYKASSCFISMTNIDCLKQRVVYNYHIFILVFVLKNQIILFITNQKWSKMRGYSASMEFIQKVIWKDWSFVWLQSKQLFNNKKKDNNHICVQLCQNSEILS